MNQTYTVTGMLPDGLTIRLDEPLPIAACKVRVAVEVIGAATVENLREFLSRIHQERAAEGVKPLPDAEIEAWVDDIRAVRG